MRGRTFIAVLAAAMLIGSEAASAGTCDVTIGDAGTNMTFAGGTYSPTTTPATLDVDDLNAQLAAGNVTVTTNGGAIVCVVPDPGNITITTAPKTIAWTAGRSLSLIADGTIAQSAGSFLAGGGTFDAKGQAVTLTDAANDFNQARVEATGGDATAVDANALALTGASSATGALTLVSDEAAGAAVGPGGLTIPAGASAISGGAPLRLYTSKRSQNSIDPAANLNGATFTPGTEYVDTLREVWGVHYPAGTATSPFTIFYKDDGTPVSPDTTPPETAIDSGPADGSTTTDSTPTFTFSSTEAGSTFACSVDGLAFGPCTSPQTLATLTDGQHTFAVRATDPAGNTDPTPAARTFLVDAPDTGDKTAPETTFRKKPKKTVKTTKKKVNVVFEFIASEVGAHFECSLDGLAFSPCTSPKKYKVAKGDHLVIVRATDAAGNKDASPARYQFKVKRKRR